MKQIALVSGKGGTGKTTLTGAFKELFSNHIMADCDVDAANLHLFYEDKIEEKFDFIGGQKAEINLDDCTGCGACEEVCRFDAVNERPDGKYEIDPFACEGCKACVLKCPVDTISLQREKAGEYYISDIGSCKLIHARLHPGEDNSGDLVAKVRKIAFEMAKEEEKDYIIIDGAPGIGCPATSSIMGVQYVVVVTEPTKSGIHDLKRMIDTIKKYRLPFGIVVNKWDINSEKTEEIEKYCDENKYDFLGKMSFDPKVVEANILGKNIMLFPQTKVVEEIREIYSHLKPKVTR